MQMPSPDEPTADQCSAHARLDNFCGMPAFAMWYPQMGGYAAKAVVVMEQGTSNMNGCFGVWVWHDGEFPFTADSHNETTPYYIHHCTPSQFISFGETILQLQETLANA
jgi:hypothetical protein